MAAEPARISIHALREESDSVLSDMFTTSPAFQSTLSVRRATGSSGEIHQYVSISIHALREESDLALGGGDAVVDISIHALREESDR